MQEELGGGDLPDIEIPILQRRQKLLPMKRKILQARGKRKKMKAHKSIPELTLTEE
jgi:hypothetical protein